LRSSRSFTVYYLCGEAKVGSQHSTKMEVGTVSVILQTVPNKQPRLVALSPIFMLVLGGAPKKLKLKLKLKRVGKNRKHFVQLYY